MPTIVDDPRERRIWGWQEQAVAEFDTICRNDKGGRELSCPICQEPYLDPVMLPECQHTFCRLCVTSLIEHSGKNCPECRLPIPPVKDLAPNRMAVRQIELIIEELLQRYPPERRLPEEPQPSSDQGGEEGPAWGREVDLRQGSDIEEVKGREVVEVLWAGTGLARIADMSHLRVLNLTESETALTELSGCPRLEELRVRVWELGVDKLPRGLKVLEMGKAPQVPVLKGFSELEELLGWEELTSVTQLPSLTHLELRGSKVRKVSHLPSLKVLKVDCDRWENKVVNGKAHACALRTTCFVTGALCWFSGLGILCCLGGCFGDRLFPQRGHVFHRLRTPTIALERLPLLERLSLSGIVPNGVLRGFPRLRELEVGLAEQNPPPAVIRGLRAGHVEEVRQHIKASPAVVGLGRLPELRQASFRGVKIKGLKEASIPRLSRLSIQGARFGTRAVEDPMGILMGAEVRAKSIRVKSEVGEVAGLSQLESLQMEGTLVRKVAQLPQLTDFGGFKHVKKIQGLQLETLDLRGTEVEEVADCPNLTHLIGGLSLRRIIRLPRLETTEGIDFRRTRVEGCPRLQPTVEPSGTDGHFSPR